MKARWAAATALVLLCMVVGCAMFQRDPGPDGVHGTPDDGKSQAEVAAEMASAATVPFGLGWLGITVEGLVTAAAVVATAISKR